MTTDKEHARQDYQAMLDGLVAILRERPGAPVSDRVWLCSTRTASPAPGLVMDTGGPFLNLADEAGKPIWGVP